MKIIIGTVTDDRLTLYLSLSFDQLQLSNKLNVKLPIVFIVFRWSISLYPLEKKQETLRVVMIAMTCFTLASL